MLGMRHLLAQTAIQGHPSLLSVGFDRALHAKLRTASKMRGGWLRAANEGLPMLGKKHLLAMSVLACAASCSAMTSRPGSKE